MPEIWKEALGDARCTIHVVQSVHEQVYVLLRGKLGVMTDDAVWNKRHTMRKLFCVVTKDDLAQAVILLEGVLTLTPLLRYKPVSSRNIDSFERVTTRRVLAILASAGLDVVLLV